jgi:hypothetical protein
MHATVSQLLSLRDGAPVDAACLAHLADCDACQREVARLRDVAEALRGLEDRGAPARAWHTVCDRLRAGGPVRSPAGRGAGDAFGHAGPYDVPGDGVVARHWRRWMPGRCLGLGQAVFGGTLAGAMALGALLLFPSVPAPIPSDATAPATVGGARVDGTFPAVAAAVPARPAALRREGQVPTAREDRLLADYEATPAGGAGSACGEPPHVIRTGGDTYEF